MDINMAILLFTVLGCMLTIVVIKISLNVSRENRIENVVRTYVNIPDINVYPGLPSVILHLKKAGILSLKNDSEIMDVLNRINKIMNMHPFGPDKEKIYKTNNIKKFFEVYDGGKTLDEVTEIVRRK